MFQNLSFMNARWVMAEASNDDIARMARAHDLPEFIARLLCIRGISEAGAQSFLKPTFARDFPDPFQMAGMRGFADFMADAILKKRKIVLLGDFDVDGATSSAIMAKFLRHNELNPQIYIPDRILEGYGPNIQALQHFKQAGAEIVVLLDCGTTAFDTIQAGRELGLEIVILDHHEPEDQLPAAAHIVNPKRKDDASGLAMLAACGVTFMACVAINNRLRGSGAPFGEAPLKSWLDLVALGTVCDMVPLTGLNRLFVRTGFSIMNNTTSAGLRALIETAGLSEPPGPYHAGFVLGPRINAGSRVNQSDIGAKLLATDDAEEAGHLAWLLHDCNEQRKTLQAAMEKDALNHAKSLGANDAVIILDDETWHSGLCGLVAGRLKDKYAKPACVIAYVKNAAGVKEGRGSARSTAGFNIAEALIAARAAGLLEKGGGHAMAGGFTIVPEKLPAFRGFMNDFANAKIQALDAHADETKIEGILSVRGVRIDFIKLLQDHIGPFGQAHAEPVFILKNIIVHMADIVGGSHIRAMIGDREGGPRLKAMAFRAAGTPLGDALLKQGAAPLDLCGHLKLNVWQGRESAELHIKDGMPGA